MRIVACVCAVLLLAGTGKSVAQTNSWISPTRGYWDDYTKWSLGVAPSTNGQSLILITNDVTKEVTIDSITAGDYPTTMVVSDLVVSAPGLTTNTLELSDVGTNTPLRVLDMLIVTNGGALQITDSALIVAAATNGGISVDGSLFMDGSSLLRIAPSLYVGLDSDAAGSVAITGGQLFLTNGDLVVGVNGAAQMILSNVQVQTWGDVFVGSGQGSSGALSITAGTFVPTYGCRLIVGMETGAVGVVTINSGNLIMTNSFITLIGGDGTGQLNLLNGTTTLGPVEVGGNPGSQGTLTIAGGTNTLRAGLVVGASLDSTGAVWMTGGQVVATNLATCVGVWGNGTLTVSNGSWLGNSILMGLSAAPAQIYTDAYGVVTFLRADGASGTLNLIGGTIALYNRLVIGNRLSGGVGVVNLTGGALYVTNAAHNAVLDIRDGQLNLAGGLLQVDHLVLTNGCGSFVQGSGTLIMGSLVDGIPDSWKTQYGFPLLDPAVASADPDGDGMNNQQEYQAGTDPTNSASSFHIVSVTPSGNNMVITWTAATNKAYALQFASGSLPGSWANLGTSSLLYTNDSQIYTNGPYGPFGTLISVPATPFITETNYTDVGGATHGPRFYRIVHPNP